ncbi:MAG: DUF2480 family protein [Cyclobacteriaceae bacterium]|nr:DUF2480 family protein [Cyclobacteriaceae bacterium]
MEEEIVNRVTASPLVTFNLEEYNPAGEIAEIDLKDILFQGLILREKDLRDFIKTHDWSGYRDKNVAIFCSADAVIPTWAYMLIGIALQPFAGKTVFGSRNDLLARLFEEKLQSVNWEQFQDKKVVIKGCSEVHVPESAYLYAAARLRPLAASIMYGEPCSTVPLYKRPK